MFRKFCMMMAMTMTMAVVAAFAAPDADAQGAPTCGSVLAAEPEDAPAAPETNDDADATSDTIADSDDAVAAENCGDAAAYPGPFTNMPAVPSSPFVAPTIVVAPQTLPETVLDPAPPSSRDLAHSGTETFVLAYLGTGLLAFGAFAMGIRRGSRLPE